MSPATETHWAVSPRADAIGAIVLIAFGAAIAVLAWNMDRFESQGATIYSAPGLWPGIVGLLIAALGAMLAWRSCVRARRSSWAAAEPDTAVLVPGRQYALAVALFLFYALMLVGRGVPFWLGTALFVAVFVFLFQRAAGRTTDVRAVTIALACGILTALVVTVVFEQLFFVRLP